MISDWIGQESPSVADVQAFEALPLDVQALARRVLLFEHYPEDVVDEWLFYEKEAGRRDAAK